MLGPKHRANWPTTESKSDATPTGGRKAAGSVFRRKDFVMNKFLSVNRSDLLSPPVMVPVALLIGLAIWVLLRPYLG